MSTKYKIGDKVYCSVSDHLVGEKLPIAAKIGEIRSAAHLELFEIVDIIDKDLDNPRYTMLIPDKKYQSWTVGNWSNSLLKKLPANSLCWNVLQDCLDMCNPQNVCNPQLCKYCYS